MRFILDTNIWISYLLARDEKSTLVQLVSVCMDPVHTLIMPPEVVHELQTSITKYPYLRTRITQKQVDALVQEIMRIAEHPDSLQSELTRYGRDPKDDYLIAYGLIYTADYLVTGDADLLVLASVEQLQIVPPADMRRMLEQHGLWSPLL
jgi:putative PIN family toxin of toxin-antitoxin system